MEDKTTTTVDGAAAHARGLAWGRVGLRTVVRPFPARYRCGGFADWDGPCGGLDCETCHPGMESVEDDEEDE